MKQFTKNYSALIIGLFMMAFGLDAYADPPNFSTLTAAVDFSTATAAVLTVFAAVAVVYIVMRGGRMILSAIGGR